MSLITWKDEYFFGIEEIDEQHKKVLIILNRLYELIDRDASVLCDDINGILKELDQYGVYHFGTEEWYFNKFNYPTAKDHIEIHNQYKQKLYEWSGKCSIDNSKKILIEMADYLKSWWEWHILRTDREYVEFFKANGVEK